MPGPLKFRFLRSGSTVADLPPARVELALVGRSNVGKSSLLNALANRKDLAHVAKAPGATRSLNVYELESTQGGRWLVDLPGYGFARVSANERRRWQGMIEGYLTGRPSLVGVLLLIDGEVGPTALDIQTVEWLRYIGQPLRPIATKVDKVSPSRRASRRAELCDRLGLAIGEVAWVSAARGIGIPDLRNEVRRTLQAD